VGKGGVGEGRVGEGGRNGEGRGEYASLTLGGGRHWTGSGNTLAT